LRSWRTIVGIVDDIRFQTSLVPQLALKSHPPSLKAKVAMEAIKAHKTAAQIAQMFGVHPTQVGGWKRQALGGLPDIFGNGREPGVPAIRRRERRSVQTDRPTEIGVGLSQKRELADKLQWIDPTHRRLSLRQQGELLGVPRSTYYYQPRPASTENLHLLRQLYLKRPFFGSHKMAVELEVNRSAFARRVLQTAAAEAMGPLGNHLMSLQAQHRGL
jgi:transposase-like protein